MKLDSTNEYWISVAIVQTLLDQMNLRRVKGNNQTLNIMSIL